jgi:hypothetical protein
MADMTVELLVTVIQTDGCVRVKLRGKDGEAVQATAPLMLEAAHAIVGAIKDQREVCDCNKGELWKVARADFAKLQQVKADGEDVAQMLAQRDKEAEAEVDALRTERDALKAERDEAVMAAVTLEQDVADAYLGVLKTLEVKLFDTGRERDENLAAAKAYSETAKLWRETCEAERAETAALRAKLALAEKALEPVAKCAELPLSEDDYRRAADAYRAIRATGVEL